eukprot:TRINITY_DN71133_c0_g1_i1.p1 TRINITY_DN71133_c0_g1~~TRINITY_DN71133_c0_g1_i1.p1  ORF type:complete len:316 (-),score=66.32 TRINITY_DN71133_c0_g1_i1:89-1036(-)
MPGPQAPRRRVNATDRCMDTVVEKAQKESVLLGGLALTDALREATKGGAAPIDGLYLSDGTKMEPSLDDGKMSRVAVSNEAARKDLNLQKVARSQKSKEERQRTRASKKGKSVDSYFAEASSAKANAILAKSSDHELMMYRDLFSFFDVDKDRTWGSIEFAQRMTDIGFPTSVEDAANLLYFAGVRDVDLITYDDFVMLMPKLRAYRMVIEKDAMAAFSARDPGTGFVTPAVLTEIVFDIVGPGGLDSKHIQAIVKKADRLKDGRITFDFFIRAMFDNTPPMVHYTPPVRRSAFMTALLGVIGCGRPPTKNVHHV